MNSSPNAAYAVATIDAVIASMTAAAVVVIILLMFSYVMVA
jgi:hypothetical protein